MFDIACVFCIGFQLAIVLVTTVDDNVTEP